MPSTLELLGPDAVTQSQLSETVLFNHRTQSAVALDGWSSALFGLPFMAAGLCTYLVAANSLPARKHAPDWLIFVIASLFFLAGSFLFAHGLRGVIRRKSYLRHAAANPNQPWLYDFHWDRSGISFSAFADMLRRFAAACGWTAFISIFVYIGFTVRGAWPFAIGGLVFGLFGLVFWYRWLMMLMDLLRYGNSRLEFGSFPFFLGGKLEARLRAPRHLASLDELTLTFRCVQERYVTSGAGNNRSQQVVCYELYKDSVSLDRRRLAASAGGSIPVDFPIPPGQPSTFLTKSPPFYWEIEAIGKSVTGPAYEATFLVPVYKPS
ncbi:MAG TPA: hypothetical protein VJR23_12615 [Candidatus Acidoferrales bacterium]|nr:hypothetical protein [Candidatus Acidoferrales bacterium]